LAIYKYMVIYIPKEYCGSRIFSRAFGASYLSKGQGIVKVGLVDYLSVKREFETGDK
jgi:hypothetical protein